jgi:hypothetical protein
MYDKYFAKVEFLKSQWDEGLITEREYFQQLVVIGVEACAMNNTSELPQAVVIPEPFEFQMDPKGNFRFQHTESGKMSNPALYNGIAVLDHAGRTYAAVSANYEGMLPHETVFEIISQSTTGKEIEENVFASQFPDDD